MDWILKNKFQLMIIAFATSLTITFGIIFYWGFTYGTIPPIPSWLIK